MSNAPLNAPTKRKLAATLRVRDDGAVRADQVAARLEDRVALAGTARPQVGSSADPRETSADDQHIEMFG